MKNNKKGFTLVELVIVVAVMAILVAVAIPTVGAITGSARESVNNSNAQTIESMLKLAEAEGTKTSADGKGSINVKTIAKVIVEAKLGITEGTFEYNYKTGDVTYKDGATAGADTVVIEFEVATGETVGTVTVTSGTGDGATSAEYKLDGSTENMGK